MEDRSSRIEDGSADALSNQPEALASSLLPPSPFLRRHAPDALCLGAILLVALALRTQHIGDISLHFDECCSWKISQFAWSEMLDAVSRDAHPPVYYMLMHLLGKLGGSSPVVMRGYSVFFGLATVVAAFWFVKETRALTSPLLRKNDWDFTPILAAALVAGSALHVEMSLQARPYTLGTLLTLVSATFLLRALRPDSQAGLKPDPRQAGWKPTPRAGDWIGFAVAATILSLTHYYCLFTVAAEFVFAAGMLVAELWRIGWSARTKRLLTGLGLSAWGLQLVWLLWMPVFLFQRERSTPQLWMQPIDWNDLFANAWLAIAGRQSPMLSPSWMWLPVAAWGAIVATLLFLGPKGARLAAVCAGLPVIATVAYGLAVRNILGAKYLIFAQLFLLVSSSLLIARVPWRPAKVLLGMALLIGCEYTSWQHFETREQQSRFPGVRGTVAYLEERRAPDEPVIVGTPFISTIVQHYAKHPAGIYVKYGGDHRGDMLGGPPLREEEYRDLERHLGTEVKFAWTIDVLDLYRPGNRFETRLPGEWKLVGQQEFREVYEQPCVLMVRAYRRIDN